MTRLTFEYDSEPYGKERDAAIIKMARNFGVETRVKNSHTLYNLDRSVMGLLYSLCLRMLLLLKLLLLHFLKSENRE